MKWAMTSLGWGFEPTQHHQDSAQDRDKLLTGVRRFPDRIGLHGPPEFQAAVERGFSLVGSLEAQKRHRETSQVLRVEGSKELK